MAHLTSQEKIDKYLADYERRRKNGEIQKETPKYSSSQEKIAAYNAAHEKTIADSPSRQQMIALERKATEEAARKKAQLQANVQQALRDQAIDSVESQALAAIKQRLNQGLGEFRQTDLQQGPFSGYQDPVELALQAQDLKGVGPQKTWRAEALKLGQQAVEQRRQEYAQQGSVKDYAERFKQTQTLLPDEKERTENVYKYAQEVPYMADFEEISSKEGANTKRRRTEEEAKKYEEEKFWAEVNGTAAPVILRNQEQDLIDKYVSDQQLKVYNYLVNSGQQEYADEYWRGVKSYAQAARNAADIKFTRDALAKLPEGFVRDTVGSALSVGANMANAVAGRYYIAEQEIREALTRERQELDPQDAAFQAGRARDALRQDVSEKLPGWGKFLYETGMSMADTAAMGVLLGPTGGALLMGSGAAVDTVRDVKERGGSDQQALTMGLVAGGAELLTEKLGFDRLGKMIGGSRGNVFREILGAMTSEGFEEGTTEIANILTDVLVMGDKSEYDALVRQYMAQGMSEDGARRQAFNDLTVQVGLAALGGGLMGSVMGGGAATVGAVARAAEQTAQRNAWREAVDYDAATNIFTEGVRGGSTYENMQRLAEQAYDRQQEATPQSAALTAPLGEGEPDASGKARAVSPTIERMAQEYGEDASVFKSHYNGSDPAQYKRGFDAMFNAGKSGLSLEMLGGVSDQLTKGMSEATKQSIYTAGRNRAANTITPGVQRLTTKKLGNNQKTQLMILDAIGKEYGLEIDVVDSIKDSNAVYRKGGRRIVVALDAAEGAYVQAAAHEAVHYIRSMSPDGYEVLKDVVLKHLTGADARFDLDTAISERMKQYEKANRQLNREDAIEEIVAEAVPTFFGDKEAVRAFVRENRTLAEKIRDFFVEFAKKVREIAERYMVSQDRTEIAELLGNTEALKEIAQTFDLALREAQEKPAGKADGEIVTSRNESKRNRAIPEGSMKNKFYGALTRQEWAGYFETLKRPEYDADLYDDGQRAYMVQSGKLVLMEMQDTGEFSVVDVYSGVTEWYNDDIRNILGEWEEGRYDERDIRAWFEAIAVNAGSKVLQAYDRHSGRFVPVVGKQNGAGRGAAGVSGGRDTHGAGVREDAVGQDQGDGTVTDAGLGTSDDGEVMLSLKKGEATEQTDEPLLLGEVMPADVNVDSESIRRQAVTAMQVGLRVKLDQQIKGISSKILRETGSGFERDGLIGELKALVNEYAKHGFSEDSVRAVNELAQEIIEKGADLTEQDPGMAAEELALRIQGDVMGMIGAKNAAQQLYGSVQRMRERFRKEYEAQLKEQKKARVAEFQRIAGELKAAKEKGDAEAQRKIMNEYRTALKNVDRETSEAVAKAASAVAQAQAKARAEKIEENRERARLRDRIMKRANDLQRMLIGKEKGKRVPTKLQGLVLDVLGALDVNGQRAAESGRETKRATEFREKLTAIKNFYAQVWDGQSKGESPEGLDGLMMTISERNMAEMAEALEVLGSGESFYLRDMDSKQLKSLDALLKNVKHTVESIGKLWRIQRYESIIQLGDASIAEMDSRGPQKITNSTVGGARDFFVLDNMEPVSYGERLGEAGAEVIQSLMDGEKIKFGKIREGSEATEKMLKEIGLRGYDIGKWRKHVQTVTLGGKNVRMTDAMLMSLYLTAKRPQGRQHLLGGGFVLRDPKRTGAQEVTIRPTEADLAHIAGLLSDKQRQLADRMGEYLSTAVAKWGNDVTQRMYLYDAFTEKHYWPLSSDSSYHKTEEPEADRMFNAIVNASFTKQTNAKANDELVIMDAFDIFGKHIGEMASYAGYAEVMTDTMAWLNYKVRNSETNLNEASVKRSVKKLLGNGGVDYMTKLLQDINGARRETEKTLVDKIGKNAKVAAVVGKISVAIQQPTSIVRAAAEINPWHLIKALRPTKGLPKGKSIGEWLRSNGTVEEMQKWSNLAWWKSNGNYDIGIGKGTDAILWGDTSIKDTVMEKIATQGGLVDPGKMDDLTWAHMWLAVKSEIKRKRKDLEVGSDEFFRAVAERFEYVMDRTQVVDTVMHRSALMRSKNDVTKQLTSFMSEPTKSYNMLMRAVMNLGRNPKDVAAHKRLMRTTAAFAASVVANAAAKGLYEAFRYRDDDEDKLLEYMVNGEFTEDWEKRILINMVSGLNPLENIPIVSTVYEAIPGDRIAKYLGFEQISDYLPSGDVAGHMGLEGISDLIKAGVDALQYMLDDNSGKRTKYGVWGALVKAASEAFGLPFAGIMTNVETLGRIFDPKWAQSKSVMATQEKAFAELYKAMASGDGKKALDIRTQLAKGMYGNQPKSPKEIDTGIYKELARQDERVMQAYKMKQAGNQTKELVALRKAIMADGFTEAQVNAAINYCETLTDTEVEEKDMEAELEAKLYSTTDLFSAVRNGDADDVAAVADYLESVSNASDPEKSIRSSVSGEFREEYVDLVKAGQNGKARALAGKLAMVGIDQEYLDGWMKDSYKADMKQHVSDGRVQKALEAIDELKEYGMDVSGIVSSLNSEFRERYVELVNSGRRTEADRLGRTLQELDLYWKDGTTNYYRDEKLEEWLEED